MKKGARKKFPLVFLVILIILLLVILSVFFIISRSREMTGNVISSSQGGIILIKFKDNPGISDGSFFDKLISAQGVKTKYQGINSIFKKYQAQSFKQSFKNSKNLQNVYEINIAGDDSASILDELKSDSNVEYTRISEPNFEAKITKEIDKINAENRGQWTAGYTLQSIMTDGEKKNLASLIVAGKPQSGGAVGGNGKPVKTSCTDSDGGLNYNQKGTAYNCSGSICSSKVSDYCINNQSLNEYYCSANSVLSQVHTCPSGCANGACISPKCTDGTLYGSCSLTKPLYCNNGSLTNKCSVCGCGSGLTCDTSTEQCGSPPPNSSIPASFDWRNASGKNYMTPVKNQGGCGSCWAFGTTEEVEAEANAYYNTQLNLDLSEQDVLSCSGGGTCSGGQPSTAMSYIQNTGLTDENCFPYTATNNLCSNKCSAWQSNAWKIQGYASVPNTITDIEKAVYQTGPISTGMAVYNDFYSYSGGIYSTNGLNFVGYHDVVIVGYGVFNNQTYYMCKNSWGTGWGESGYFRILAGNSEIGMSGFTFSVNAPIPSTPQTKVCEDKDGDGYCNWGLGPKPASGCPPCSNIRDCNDADPSVNTVCS